VTHQIVLWLTLSHHRHQTMANCQQTARYKQLFWTFHILKKKKHGQDMIITTLSIKIYWNICFQDWESLHHMSLLQICYIHLLQILYHWSFWKYGYI